MMVNGPLAVLASHIPLPSINHGNSCDIYKNHSSACSDLYLTYMGMFAIVAVPLTCLSTARASLPCAKAAMLFERVLICV